MKNIKLDAVGLFVKDIKTMVEFYRDVLGFQMEWDGGPFAQCTSGGARLMMYPRKDFEELVKTGLGYPAGLNGTMELAIDLPGYEDVDIEYTRLTEAGARGVYPPKTEMWGMRSSYIADPEGNLIEIGSWNKGE